MTQMLISKSTKPSKANSMNTGVQSLKIKRSDSACAKNGKMKKAKNATELAAIILEGARGFCGLETEFNSDFCMVVGQRYESVTNDG